MNTANETDILDVIVTDNSVNVGMAWRNTAREERTIVGTNRFQSSTQLVQNLFPNTLGYCVAYGNVFADGSAESCCMYASNVTISVAARPL